MGGFTSLPGDKTFSTGVSDRLPSTTFNILEELTHISALGAPQRLGVDSPQITSPNPTPASRAYSQVNVVQAAPDWSILSNYPSTAVGSVSPSGSMIAYDMTAQDAGNKAGGGALPSLTDASTSETELGYTSPDRSVPPTTGGVVGPGTTGSEDLPGSGGPLANAGYTDPVYDASVSHDTKKGTISLSTSIILPTSCIFVFIFEYVRRRNLRKRARLRAHQLRLDPTKSYFSLDTSR
ncbi:hypothetical protein BJX96DRAFT_176217 [Aspergillus floccosus]